MWRASTNGLSFMETQAPAQCEETGEASGPPSVALITTHLTADMGLGLGLGLSLDLIISRPLTPLTLLLHVTHSCIVLNGRWEKVGGEE